MEKGLKAERPVLCVDVDGTLIKSDLLYESVIALFKLNPLYLFLLPFWLLKGKAFLKREIARRVTVAPESLPYNNQLLDYLINENQSGRKLALASASDALLVEPIAKHLGIFQDVLSSDGVTNLAGTHKLEAINRKFSPGGFDYAGNSCTDLPLWQAALGSIVVSNDRRLIEKVQKEARLLYLFDQGLARGKLRLLLKEIRVHQWVKNLLLFIPAFMAHEVTWDGLGKLLLAFVAFSLCASSVYVLNDLIDLEADRHNSSKKQRPLAAGSLPLLWGFALAPALLAAAFGLALLLPLKFLALLAVYYVTTLAYSLSLKRIAVVDVCVLALLYTLRVLAGAFVVQVLVSPWLLAFCMFMFFSLACVKRLSELYSLRKERQEKTKGRGYFTDDLEPLGQFGVASGYISALVLALYINSKEVTNFYSNEEVLWALCPLILFWVSRVLLLAHRGEMNEDPIIFAIKDRVSYAVALVALLIWLAAI